MLEDQVQPIPLFIIVLTSFVLILIGYMAKPNFLLKGQFYLMKMSKSSCNHLFLLYILSDNGVVKMQSILWLQSVTYMFTVCNHEFTSYS